MGELLNKIRKILSSRKKRAMSSDGMTKAAVLLPILLTRGTPHVLFTKRTDKVAHHKGEISFPGGMQDKEDRDLLDTALRECHEEIGILPDSVEILGELDDTVTVASNFHLTAFVGALRAPFAYKTNPMEIERIIEVPLSHLQNPSHVKMEYWGEGDQRHPVYFYTYGDDIIWGATARILKHFLDVIA